MWPISELMTVNMLTSFFSLFFEADYNSTIVLQLNIKVVEKRASASSYEFPTSAILAANQITLNRFPNEFLFGAASSAYQIEGAHNTSGKGVSVWDYWTHAEPSIVDDRSNGDVACMSYYRYLEDVQLVKNLGANVYRISLSWTRLVPNAEQNQMSLEGIRYYNDLINAMLLNGLTPLVCIHHFDVPHRLQMLGGWTNPRMIERFESFARLAFGNFGDRVKHWITIADPWELCNLQFGDALRPIYADSGVGNYLCGHHVLLAHARVYRMYRKEFQWLQKGRIGIGLSTRWFEPEDYTSPEDAEAAERSFHFSQGWFLNPLLGERGGYPAIMRLEVGVKSALQGFRSSRLPEFSPEEIEMVRGSLDFLGIGFHTTYSAKFVELKLNGSDGIGVASLETDMGAKWLVFDEAYGAFDVKNTAENFGKLLHRLNDEYVLPQVYITANGYPDFGELFDVDRAIYHRDHIDELLGAMKAGVDVRGYMAWSLMDSFEWKAGYSKHYGLYGVDFADGNRARKEKFSAQVIRSIYESKLVPEIIATS